MDDAERKRWEQQEGEPSRWFQYFTRFRLLGPDRSLLAVFNTWRFEKSRGVSTSCPKTWREAAEQWHWRERAEAWDQWINQQAAAEAEQERLQILSTGYAQKHERVRALNRLAELLVGEVEMAETRWLADVKQIGSGEMAERVDLVRFNGALVEQARGTLADLASEMGERVKNVDVKSDGKALPAATIQVYLPDNHREKADDAKD